MVTLEEATTLHNNHNSANKHILFFPSIALWAQKTWFNMVIHVFIYIPTSLGTTDYTQSL